MTALLAEDNPLDVRMIRNAIAQEEWDIDLVVVDDGEKAMQYLSGQPPYTDGPRPDFVILDLNLPKRSGAEVLSLLRTSPELSALPVVLLSSSPEDMIRETVSRFHYTADLFVTKPISVMAYLSIGGLLRQCYESKTRHLPDPTEPEAIPL